MHNLKQIIIQAAAVVLGLWFGSPMASAQPTVSSATKFLEIKIKRNTMGDMTSQNAWSDVLAASNTVTMPPNTKILVVVRFNAVSRCYRDDGSNLGTCNVRVLLNGSEMLPNTQVTSHFDDVGITQGAMHTIERSRLVCTGPNDPPANIQVQQAVTHSPQTSFLIKNWHMTVEKYELPGQCNTD